jgi:hypothetical protein
MKTLAEIMRQYPDVTYFGIGLYDESSLSPSARALAYLEKRHKLARAEASFALITPVLAIVRKRQAINTSVSSYGLKHGLEHFLEDYVSNGVCIAAALACGFHMRRCSPTSPNVYFNIVTKDLVGLRGTQSSQLFTVPNQHISPALRFAILQRDGYRCCLCGVTLSDGSHVRLEVDHRISRADRGSNDPPNLWTLCFACNRGKGSRSLYAVQKDGEMTWQFTP